MDLEDLVRARSTKHPPHLIKSKLLYLVTDGFWGVAGSCKSLERGMEGLGGVVCKCSLLKRELKTLRLTAGGISAMELQTR